MAHHGAVAKLGRTCGAEVGMLNLVNTEYGSVRPTRSRTKACPVGPAIEMTERKLLILLSWLNTTEILFCVSECYIYDLQDLIYSIGSASCNIFP